MRPLGLNKKGFWDFVDLRGFKNRNERGSCASDRAARKNLKRLMRSLKRAEKNSAKRSLNKEVTHESLT